MHTNHRTRYRLLIVLTTILGITACADAQQASRSGQLENTEYLKLIDRMGQLGQQITTTEQPAQLFALTMEQADTLDRILTASRTEDKEGWTRQLAECLLSAAIQSPENDLRAASRLTYLREEIDHAAPGSAIAAYVSFQQLELEHTKLVQKLQADTPKIQEAWRHLLANYINAYPRAKETTKALIELAALSEAVGKDEDARRCYRFILDNQPSEADLQKAQGALNRLDLAGQEIRLALPTLKDETSSDEPFDIRELRGKIIVLYFWTAKNEQCLEDLRRLGSIIADERGQRCELVCVNCDVNPTEAAHAIQNLHVTGVQLHQRKGNEGLVSHRLGLFEVPHLMVVGKDGRVLSKSVELTGLQKIVAEHSAEPTPEIVKPSRMTTARWTTIGK